MLDRVTLTGADNSVLQPGALSALSLEFPFVEWGILFSFSQNGSHRFPDAKWMSRFINEVQGTEFKRCLHLCGRVVRDLLAGHFEPPLPALVAAFQRVQLNFHAETIPIDAKKFHAALRSLGDVQFIFQLDEHKGHEYLEAIYGENDETSVDAVPLFDASGGAGIVAKEWPKPEYMRTDSAYVYHGYAGGLGPNNIHREICRISEAAGKCRHWIDMETKIRSDDDSVFDLQKCRDVLELAAPFVGAPAVA